MFVDELEIKAAAGNGGDGVIRWRRERFKPFGGPAGGNGGKGGDVFVRAKKDLGLLSKYTGTKEFRAENAENGRKNSQHGKDGADLYIDVPVGSKVTDKKSGRTYTLETDGEAHRILRGGEGGFGNEHFKSSTNRSPKQRTEGKSGEESIFYIEVSLVVDVGLIGFPNAGKSTLLNTLTNARSNVGSYPFTTLEPHLGDFYGFIIADIPGLIKGASGDKGLGQKFLRHVSRTKMLLHLVSLEEDDVTRAYKIIQEELKSFDPELLEKEEWVILSKADLADTDKIEESVKKIKALGKKVFVVSSEEGRGIDALRSDLTNFLNKKSLF